MLLPLYKKLSTSSRLSHLYNQLYAQAQELWQNFLQSETGHVPGQRWNPAKHLKDREYDNTLQCVTVDYRQYTEETQCQAWSSVKWATAEIVKNRTGIKFTGTRWANGY